MSACGGMQPTIGTRGIKKPSSPFAGLNDHKLQKNPAADRPIGIEYRQNQLNLIRISVPVLEP